MPQEWLMLTALEPWIGLLSGSGGGPRVLGASAAPEGADRQLQRLSKYLALRDENRPGPNLDRLSRSRESAHLRSSLALLTWTGGRAPFAFDRVE